MIRALELENWVDFQMIKRKMVNFPGKTRALFKIVSRDTPTPLKNNTRYSRSSAIPR